MLSGVIVVQSTVPSTSYCTNPFSVAAMSRAPKKNKALRRGVIESLFCRTENHPSISKSTADSPSFVELAEERKFDYICSILADPATPSEWLWTPEATPLHLLCQKRPTVAVVQKTLDIFWANGDLRVDKHGRTPLHVAVMNNCSASIVHLLLGDEIATAASVQDTSTKKRYPLHYAALAGNKRSRKVTAEAAVENTLETIQLLLDAYPDALTERDGQGMTPLDLALAPSNKMDPRIISGLRYQTQVLFKRKSNNNNNSIQRTATTTDFSGEGRGEDSATFSELMDEFFLEELPREISAVMLNDDHRDDDDLSSVGSRGAASLPPRRRTTSMFPYVCVDL